MKLSIYKDAGGLVRHNVSIETLVGTGESGSDISAAILEQFRTESLATVRNKHAAALELLTGNSTPAERDTWPPKVAFAHAYLAGETTESADAAAEQALLPGETLQQFCETIATKESAFFNLSMFAEGFKRKTNAAIESAESVAEIEAINAQAATDMAAAIDAFKQQLSA